MDYYVVINGQKQGPYDVLGFIKKVKNGIITGETQVSTNEKGPFRPACEVEELKSIIKAESGYRASMGKDLQVNLNATLNEGAELWTRRVTEYTLFFGIIVVIGYTLSASLKQVQLLADYSFVVRYLTSAVTLTLLGFYYYYVLMTKRSQDPDLKELKALLKYSLLHLFIFSCIISGATFLLGINTIFTSITVAVTCIILSLLAFVPFLIVDHRMGLRRAVLVSLESFRSLHISVGASIFVIMAVNIGAVFLPGLMGNIIFFLALIITLPVSVAILANIYDHILA